jgi:hypothetical protein
VRAVTEAESEETAEEAPGRKLSRRTIVIVAAVAVLVLAGAGVGIFALTRGGDGSPAAGNAPGASTSAAPSTPPAGATTSGPEPSQPNSGPVANPAEVGNANAVAQKAIDAINTHDVESLKKISCDPGSTGPADETLPDAKVELVSPPELTGDTATVQLKLTIGDQSTTTPLPLRKQNGTWCVE